MSESAPASVLARRAELEALAASARQWLFMIDTVAAARRFAWIPWLALPLIALGHRWIQAEWISLALINVWMVAALLRAWRSRLTPYGALAAWDAAGGRHDALSSAHVFAHDPTATRDPGRLLHLDRTSDTLPQAARQLATDLPLPRLRWTWLAPVAAIAFSLLPLWHPVVAPGDQPLTADQLAAAAAEAARLAQPPESPLTNLPDLTDQERRALEELDRTQRELAEALKQADGKSPRDVLDDLEKQARAAEALAKQLGADANAWASEKLLAQLRQHPDTADLADAVIAKQPARAAEESRNLASTLKDPQITSEVAERLARTLDRALTDAQTIESEKPVDAAVEAADQDLEQNESAAAGEEFEKLAATFDRQAQRDQAREQLEKMADRLREAGSSIMGKQGEGLKKLAGQSGPPAASPMPSLQPLSSLGEPSDASSDLPIPGLDPMNDVKPGDPSQRRGTPIPGTGPPPKNAKPLAVIPGTAPKDAKPLAIAAPIPGSGKGRAAIPVPGAGGQGPPATGGTLPGRGATESGNKPTDLQAAAAQGEVAVNPGSEGESFTQSIDGQPRQEAVARAARQSAAAFLKEQEQALDTENLPPSRREQIRRYFESLRKKVGE